MSAVQALTQRTVNAARRRRLLTRLGGIVLLALIVSAVGGGGRGGRPYDPRSTARDGARGIVDVMRALGTEVALATRPTEDDGVALLLEDRLSVAQRTDLRDWVADGGRLVLADPESVLSPALTGRTSIGFTEPTIEPRCDDPATADVQRVSISDAFVMRAGPGDTACFPRADGHWMVRTPTDAGEVIALGGAYSMANELLDDADNAVLFVALLTPDEGDDLTVLQPENPAAAGGEDSLFDLLPTGVKTFFVQIPLIWLAVLWWRGRRDGRLAVEDPPIHLEASEQTVAFGRLLQRAGLHGEAALLIRDEVNDRLARRIGVERGTDLDTVITLAAARTAADEAQLRAVLMAPQPADERELVSFTRRAALLLADLRTEASGPPPTPDPAPSPDRSTSQ